MKLGKLRSRGEVGSDITRNQQDPSSERMGCGKGVKLHS